MNKQWYAYVILVALLLCAGVFAPLLISLTKPPRDLPEIQNNPERIISLAPNLTEILFALGLADKIVAVSNDSDYPHDAASIKKVGSFWQPDTEAIIASKPDLVIALWFQQQKAVADTLTRLRYQVLTLKIEKIEELLTAIEKIGATTACKQQAEQLVKNISNQLNDLRLMLVSTNRVKVLWVVQLEPLRVAGRSTFLNEIIEIAGGQNAIGPTLQKYPALSSEELLASAPQVIIQSAMAAESITKQQQDAQLYWSKWTTLPAVKNDRVFVVDSDVMLRLGPRLPQGVKVIARYLHPDIFAKANGSEQQTR